MIFEQTSIWKRSLGDDADGPEVARLRSEFFKFRKKAKVLLAKIAETLPSLTVHDVSHIDALWETADLIVGPDYPINPMEAFVLGGAFLLHDSALCFDAYSSGKDGLRQTPQWKDAYASEQTRNSENGTGLDTETLESAADFSALRLLHGDHAKELVERSWVDPDTHSTIFLIEDEEIRKRYGRVIGDIAASHAWDIDDVSEKLQGQINSPGDMPQSWRIDPIKIACILRCADAIHIDNRRAPDFMHALTRRDGISLRHWKAQNWLSRADIDATDKTRETIIFTSNRDFEKADSEEWWIAFDAIWLANKELQSSNSLLKSRSIASSPEFASKRIAGVSSPDQLRTYVRTSGWEPYNAELHVSNVQRLVKNLGGAAVYGKAPEEHFVIVLRELIQNARDAISARVKLDAGFQGKIEVKIFDDSDGRRTVAIADNGIGMSRRGLVNGLLDFGSSFWTSDLLKKEFPGLQSSGFQSVGQYGIGFFSIFMVADNVCVSSRAYDKGLDKISTMEFKNGLTLRPIISSGRPSNFQTWVSTCVQYKVLPKFEADAKAIEINQAASKSISIEIVDILSRLVCGLDVEVHADIFGTNLGKIHTPPADIINFQPALLSWLSRISLVKYRVGWSDDSMQDAVKRLRPIYSEKGLSGLAAISLDPRENGTGLTTIGGLHAGGARGVGGSPSYYGYIDTYAASAKRDAGPRVADESSFHKWALEQRDMLRKMQLNPLQRLLIGHRFSEFKLDPSDDALIMVIRNGQFHLIDLNQAIEIMIASGIAIFRMKQVPVVDVYVRSQQYLDYFTYRAADQGPFNSLELEGNVPKDENSFIGCVYRKALEKGYMLRCDVTKDIAESIGGHADAMVFSLQKTDEN